MAATPRITGIQGHGDLQTVNSAHRAMTPDALTEALEYGEQSGQHVWIMIMTHLISVAALEQMTTEPLMFDAETLLTADLGCAVCEQEYEPRLLRRRCPGDPG